MGTLSVVFSFFLPVIFFAPPPSVFMLRRIDNVAPPALCYPFGCAVCALLSGAALFPGANACTTQILLTYAIKDTVSVLYWYGKLSRNGKFFERIFGSFFCFTPCWPRNRKAAGAGGVGELTKRCSARRAKRGFSEKTFGGGRCLCPWGSLV